MKRQVLSIVLVAAMAGSMVCGCSGNSQPESLRDTNSASQEKVNAKFGFITGTGGLGDKNMNDATYDGLKKLEEQGAQINVVEPDDASDYTNLQSLFAERKEFDAVFCISYEQTDALAKTAEKYPEQRFILVDSEVEADNVTNVQFRSEETGFQLGVLAGLLEKDSGLPFMNEEQKVGFVGGQDNPVINQFASGYEAGVRLVNPDAQVDITYVGSFTDPSKAAELANSLYTNGCDIVFACAGGSGLGVFSSAEKNDGYAFGIEVNQNSNAPDHIIASGMRLWDVVMTDVGNMAAQGSLEGGTLTYGISENALKVGFEGSNVQVDDKIKEEMNRYFDKVSSGEYILPKTLDGVDAFLQGTER